MLKRFAEPLPTARRNKSRRRQQHLPTFETLEGRMLLAVLPLGPMQGGTPNYFGPEPNWAYSPQPTVNPGTGAVTGGIQKFVDSLPGLYFANANQAVDAANLAAADNNLGQFIPVAVPDTMLAHYPELAAITDRSAPAPAIALHPDQPSLLFEAGDSSNKK